MLAGVAAALIVVFCGLHFQYGTIWARDLRFHFERPGYEARVRALLLSPQTIGIAGSTDDVHIDRRGDVVCVAFVQPGGLLDNWTGIVYDPTGAVEKINAAKDWNDWHSPRFDDVRELFGGDLVFAHPLGGGWYRCSFT